jgi:hypothetical protein
MLERPELGHQTPAEEARTLKQVAKFYGVRTWALEWVNPRPIFPSNRHPDFHWRFSILGIVVK